MKELLLGNEAVARGLYEAGVRVVSSYRAHRAQRSPRQPLPMTKFTVNGAPTRRSRRRLPRARPSAVHVPSAV